MRRRAASFISIGLAIGFGAFASTAGAVPAYPDAEIALEQPSGEEFTAGLYGDEWSGGYETLDGYAIEQNRATDRWEYAKRNSNGRLVAGGTSATEEPPPGLDRDLQESRRHRVSRAEPANRAPDPPNNGTHPSIVILAEFTDQATLGTTAANWASRYFGSSDSVADYYDEVSFGDLDIAPGAETSGTANDGVVGWVNVGTAHPGSDDPSGVITTQNQQTFKDAVAAADPFVNYGSFDANGNGTVTPNELHITVITAGYEASICGAAPNSTWGHKWGAYSVGFPQADGVQIPEYTMFGEAHCGGSGAYMATLGIMVHEIGHDLDWPDYYDNTDAPTDPDDTGANGDGGVGQWSVMATGSWSAESGEAPGETPPHPDAFNKSYQGWITPTAVTGTSTRSLEQAATNPSAVQVLDNPGGVDWINNVSSGTGEYFLIENRQPVGYDAALPGCGILIWHVDETRGTNNNNNSFDARRLLDLEEADGGTAGLPYSAANAADAFLGGTFDAGSNPNSNLYSGGASGVSVSNFSSACAASMSATVTGPGGGGNNPPVLAPIGNKNATVGNQLSFQVSATDADGDALTYSAVDLPSGANFNPGTRTFTWTPSAAGTFPGVEFRVSDGTESDIEDITITVTGGGGNNPPQLASIGNKNATVGNQLSFQVSATDGDGDALTYSASNLPTGANFNPGTRTFTWTPTAAGTHPNVHFEVTDGTDSDSEDITITVTGGGDTTAPDTFIDSSPPDKVKLKRGKRKIDVFYEFSASEPATLECSVNGGAWQPNCPESAMLTVRKGNWTVEVRATDAAGNVDQSPASDSFKVVKRKRKRN